MKNIYYIYIYLDPRKSGQYEYNDLCFLYEPIYIGKGKDKRYKKNNNRNEYFNNKINKIKFSELEPVILKLLENLKKIGKLFGVSQTTISDIKRKKIWTYIKEGVNNGNNNISKSN